EYKHRFLIHGLIYTLCFAAPWPDYHNGFHGVALFSFIHNGSLWFRIANNLSHPIYQRFAMYWNSTLLGILLFAFAGALLRTWGAAYLGASTVKQGGLVSQRVVADGPYRFVRNPLYLGTILHTVALAFLMRPEAALLCVVLITLLQLRLIGREEPFLIEQQGEAYRAYLEEVPRIVPSLHPVTAPHASRPNWTQGVLSEIYMLGVAISFAALGWADGFSWENTVLHVTQGVLISLGLSVVARAFIPKATV
ncbi:MAG TPA: isoprenylcysteine carboxylmethyltransferase family protein, partial [Terriglobus sp.]